MRGEAFDFNSRKLSLMFEAGCAQAKAQVSCLKRLETCFGVSSLQSRLLCVVETAALVVQAGGCLAFRHRAHGCNNWLAVKELNLNYHNQHPPTTL